MGTWWRETKKEKIMLFINLTRGATSPDHLSLEGQMFADGSQPFFPHPSSPLSGLVIFIVACTLVYEADLHPVRSLIHVVFWLVAALQGGLCKGHSQSFYFRFFPQFWPLAVMARAGLGLNLRPSACSAVQLWLLLSWGSQNPLQSSFPAEFLLCIATEQTCILDFIVGSSQILCMCCALWTAARTQNSFAKLFRTRFKSP